MKMSVVSIEIKDIKEHDVILFLKKSIANIKSSGGADYILTIDRNSPDLKYSYNPSVLRNDETFDKNQKVFEGKLKSLSQAFSIFKVENMNFFETQEYLRKSLDNLAVLPQFYDEIKEILNLDESTDLGEKIVSILSEPISSIIFCNTINQYFNLIHKIHFYDGGYSQFCKDFKDSSDLFKLKTSLEVIFGV